MEQTAHQWPHPLPTGFQLPTLLVGFLHFTQTISLSLLSSLGLSPSSFSEHFRATNKELCSSKLHTYHCEQRKLSCFIVEIKFLYCVCLCMHVYECMSARVYGYMFMNVPVEPRSHSGVIYFTFLRHGLSLGPVTSLLS